MSRLFGLRWVNYNTLARANKQGLTLTSRAFFMGSIKLIFVYLPSAGFFVFGVWLMIWFAEHCDKLVKGGVCLMAGGIGSSLAGVDPAWVFGALGFLLQALGLFFKHRELRRSNLAMEAKARAGNVG